MRIPVRNRCIHRRNNAVNGGATRARDDEPFGISGCLLFHGALCLLGPLRCNFAPAVLRLHGSGPDSNHGATAAQRTASVNSNWPTLML